MDNVAEFLGVVVVPLLLLAQLHSGKLFERHGTSFAGGGSFLQEKSLLLVSGTLISPFFFF